MIIYQKFIYRDDLQRNPDILYVFGDNAKRFGMGGQAKEMRGEPNAIGIATKDSPSESMSDDDYINNIMTIMEDMKPIFNHLINLGNIVLPSDGIGTGLANLSNEAPRTWDGLCMIMNMLRGIDEYHECPMRRQGMYDAYTNIITKGLED